MDFDFLTEYEPLRPIFQEGKCNSTDLLSVKCNLHDKELWDKAHALGTEMILTNKGRTMFPTIKVSFSGLNIDQKYGIVLEIQPVDKWKYKYLLNKSFWVVEEESTPIPPDVPRLFFYELNGSSISFNIIKLTNNVNAAYEETGQILLNPMQRYQPRISLIKLDAGASQAQGGAFTAMLDFKNLKYRTYVFPATQFIAVTEFQNHLMPKLRTDHKARMAALSNSFQDATLESSEHEGWTVLNWSH